MTYRTVEVYNAAQGRKRGEVPEMSRQMRGNEEYSES
jgi:hypothetical protein